jgi:hypothetical protein
VTIIVQSAVKGVEEVKREREINKPPEVPVVPNPKKLNEIVEIASGYSRQSSMQDQLVRMDGELLNDNYDNPLAGRSA